MARRCAERFESWSEVGDIRVNEWFLNLCFDHLDYFSILQVGALAVFLLRHQNMMIGGQESLQRVARVIAINLVFAICNLICCFFLLLIQLHILNHSQDLWSRGASLIWRGRLCSLWACLFNHQVLGLVSDGIDNWSHVRAFFIRQFFVKHLTLIFNPLPVCFCFCFWTLVCVECSNGLLIFLSWEDFLEGLLSHASWGLSTHFNCHLVGDRGNLSTGLRYTTCSHRGLEEINRIYSLILVYMRRICRLKEIN